MPEKSSPEDQTFKLIIGVVSSPKHDFFSTINSFKLLAIIDKDDRLIVDIPMWPLIIPLIAILLSRAVRSQEA